MRNDYSSVSGGISAANRRLLEAVHREAAGVVTVADAARIWDVDKARASRLLRSLADRGWLTRPKRGLYVPVPLEAAESGQWREDSWLIAVKLFPEGYIGGWSACEHWELTDQLFRTVVVYTTKRVNRREIELAGMELRVKVIRPERLFGTRTVWRGRVPVQVSDPARTIIDILDDPELGGGIRQVAEMVEEFTAGEHRDDELLIEYGDRLGNRTVFKRLGYLLEARDISAPALVAAARDRVSAGITTLDPSAPPGGRILTRWNLRVNVAVGGGA